MYLYYMRHVLGTGETVREQFTAEHYREVGIAPRSLGGMPQLEAHTLINKWNVSQAAPACMYGLETAAR